MVFRGFQKSLFFLSGINRNGGRMYFVNRGSVSEATVRLMFGFSLQHHWAVHDELWRRLHRSHRQDSYLVRKKGSGFRRSDHQQPPLCADDTASLMRWWILGVMIQGEDADTEANRATSLATIRAELSESWDATGKGLKPLFDRMQILINSLQKKSQEEKQNFFLLHSNNEGCSKKCKKYAGLNWPGLKGVTF